jgi:uncharacterized membrane protein YphA (DoxX/SURF4 family)
MLSLLPQILFLAPFSAFILRIAAACTFFYIALRMIEARDDMIGTRFPIIGLLPVWAVWLGATTTTIVATLLFVGLFTQLIALFGIIIALKLFIFAPRLQHVLPLSRGMYALLFIICLSLLLTGAGAFAFDLPL